MLAAERRDLLMARLRRDGKLVARDLAAELGLSEDSVRWDLRELAAAGLCQRVYGGALPASPLVGTTHARRSEIALESKRRVAARAAELITPGTTVILDGDTTGLAVAEALRPDLVATIVTHSPTTAAALETTVRRRLPARRPPAEEVRRHGRRRDGRSRPGHIRRPLPARLHGCAREGRADRRRPRRGRHAADPPQPGGGHLRSGQHGQDRDCDPVHRDRPVGCGRGRDRRACRSPHHPAAWPTGCQHHPAW